jgi:hypothetical protein
MLRRAPLALAAILTTSAWAQSVISAHSGVIHYKEGQVEVDGKPIQQDPQKGQFGDIKTGQTLEVKDGQAEVLLTPGVFLRVAENSSFRMISNKLADTRVEVLSGSVMVEVGELLQDNAITLVVHNADVALTKKGLYRVDIDPSRLRVYDGEARVSSASQDPITAHKGREISFGETLQAQNFDPKLTDAFYNWCARRDQYVAEANIYAAKSARDMSSGFTGTSGYSGYGYGGYGSGSGSWAWNPWFGMFTYMPYGGIFNSPFGFGYYSPGMVSYLYMPGSPYYLGGGSAINNTAIVRNGSASTPLRNAAATPAISRGGTSSSAPSFGGMRGSGGGSSGSSAGPAIGGGVGGGGAGAGGGHVGARGR